MAPPFTVPCEGREAWFLHHPQRESNPGLFCGSPLHVHNHCATSAPLWCRTCHIICSTLVHVTLLPLVQIGLAHAESPVPINAI